MVARKPFRPRVSPLFLLAAILMASIIVLVWMGWRLIDRERAAEAQQRQQELNDAADRIADNLRAAFAAESARLGAWMFKPPEPQEIDNDLGVAIFDRASEPPARIFADAETVEFQQNRLEDAARRYRILSEQKDKSVQAAALLRLSRVLVKSERRTEALIAYARLVALGPISVSGVPADLVGRNARAQLSADRSKAAELRRDLEHGRWALPRGQFEFYWLESGRVLGDEGRTPAWTALAEAAAIAKASPGLDSVSTGDRRFVLLRRTSGSRETVLIAPVEYFLARAIRNERFHCEIVDANGRVLAGTRGPGPRRVVRTIRDSQVSWNLAVTNSDAIGRNAASRERFLMIGLGAMILFLGLATFLAARTIRREAAVARLQSDFVSAVSHEFRSPLTSMRHMSEMLVLGRVADEARREQYYASLLGETRRLQRLVESLLNFGRMEAGARPYRFTELDPAELVRQVSAEFEPLAAREGRRIDLSTSVGESKIQADAEALSLAVRNLIDNALKYSPGRPAVWVDCAARNGQFAIEVRDEGLGIRPSEQQSIFDKFVRGSAAERTNAKGTGVGLAMVAQIVHAHGGKIEVKSELERGSTFTLVLPGVQNR